MFDTLAYANKLTEAGLTDKQAKAHAEALISVVNENLATKHDIKELELKFEGRFAMIDGRFLRLEWMMGVVIAGILSLVLKAFFM